MQSEDEAATLSGPTIERIADNTEAAAKLGVDGVRTVEIRDPLVEADPEGAQVWAELLSAILQRVREVGPSREVEDPTISRMLYGLSPVMDAWRQTIPSAAALHPLYEPLGTLGSGEAIDLPASTAFIHGKDGRGIRSRGAVLTALLAEESGDGRWASLACGAARPTCEAVAVVRSQGQDVRAAVLDWDDSALDLARRTATEFGVAEHVETHRVNVLKAARVQEVVPPGSCSAVECLGFFEYLPVRETEGRVDAVAFLSLAYSLVAPGGQLVFANMLDTHPELPFTLHAVRWPMIVPRSLEEILEIVDLAGIERSAVELWLPEDGVYAVLSVRR